MLNSSSLCEIHFYDEKTASVTCKTNRENIEKQIDFMVVMSYLTRILCISTRDDSSRLCYMIERIKSNKSYINNIMGEFGCSLIRYRGYPAKKKIRVKLNVSNDKFKFVYTVHFDGFGFFIFKKGLEYYCPLAVIVLIKYLYDKYDQEYMNALFDGMMCCIDSFKYGDLNHGNQLNIVSSAMEHVIRYNNVIGL